jgi:hypothetical protein
MMFAYGTVKVIKAQFPDPGLDRLLEPFGQASPMGLLWTFMGASQPYNMFTGLGEIVGGLLLTTRRTTLLGAIVSAGVLAHVVVLNFCYDVPVKLFSLHLLAMALFLAAPDARRLADFFLAGRAVPPADLPRLVPWAWPHSAVILLRTMLVAGLLGLAVYAAWLGRVTNGDRSPRSPLYGVWNVEAYVVDGKVRPPLLSDDMRWRRVVFDGPRETTVYLMTDKQTFYPSELDADGHALTLKTGRDSSTPVTLTVERPREGQLILSGRWDGQPMRAVLRRSDEPFTLTSRGFHWISEYPFSR